MGIRTWLYSYMTEKYLIHIKPTPFIHTLTSDQIMSLVVHMSSSRTHEPTLGQKNLSCLHTDWTGVCPPSLLLPVSLCPGSDRAKCWPCTLLKKCPCRFLDLIIKGTNLSPPAGKWADKEALWAPWDNKRSLRSCKGHVIPMFAMSTWPEVTWHSCTNSYAHTTSGRVWSLVFQFFVIVIFCI